MVNNSDWENCLKQLIRSQFWSLTLRRCHVCHSSAAHSQTVMQLAEELCPTPCCIFSTVRLRVRLGGKSAGLQVCELGVAPLGTRDESLCLVCHPAYSEKRTPGMRLLCHLKLPADELGGFFLSELSQRFVSA